MSYFTRLFHRNKRKKSLQLNRNQCPSNLSLTLSLLGSFIVLYSAHFIEMLIFHTVKNKWTSDNESNREEIADTQN